MRNLFYPTLFLLICMQLAGCQSNSQPTQTKAPMKAIQAGTWRGVLSMQNQQMPFVFDIQYTNNQPVMVIHNDTEQLTVDEVTIDGDSARITMHIFDSQLIAHISENTLTGYFVKHYLDNYRIPFTATYNQTYRFAPTRAAANPAFDGKWAVTFTHKEDGDTPAIGEFKVNGNKATGTFLTETGDYRFLEGHIDGNTMHLSTFDGNHAFLFQATVNGEGNGITGHFWSGSHWHETFVATKNPDATLRDAYSLTYLKEGYEGIEFSFPGLDGKPVSPNDAKYKGKVLVLQLFGTWCPNCMDETRFFSEWYNSNKDRGVEFLALAYEQKDDFEYAKSRIEKVKQKLNVEYDFVVAGVSDKKKAAETLPMLNHVMSYPTSIFIDRQGKVRKIHTGFTGPGTGVHYTRYVEEFNAFMNELLNE